MLQHDSYRQCHPSINKPVPRDDKCWQNWAVFTSGQPRDYIVNYHTLGHREHPLWGPRLDCNILYVNYRKITKRRFAMLRVVEYFNKSHKIIGDETLDEGVCKPLSVFLKRHPFYFCHNFVKLTSILILFGRCIAMNMFNKRGIITTVWCSTHYMVTQANIK